MNKFKYNIQLCIDYSFYQKFFYKIKLPCLSLATSWTCLLPAQQKDYSNLYVNLLKVQKFIENKSSNWKLKKKKSLTSFQKHLYLIHLNKNDNLIKKEVKPKFRQFKEIHLKGYTPQEERIFLFNESKQNIFAKLYILNIYLNLASKNKNVFAPLQNNIKPFITKNRQIEVYLKGLLRPVANSAQISKSSGFIQSFLKKIDNIANGTQMLEDKHKATVFNLAKPVATGKAKPLQFKPATEGKSNPVTKGKIAKGKAMPLPFKPVIEDKANPVAKGKVAKGKAKPVTGEKSKPVAKDKAKPSQDKAALKDKAKSLQSKDNKKDKHKIVFKDKTIPLQFKASKKGKPRSLESESVKKK